MNTLNFNLIINPNHILIIINNKLINTFILRNSFKANVQVLYKYSNKLRYMLNKRTFLLFIWALE